MKEYLYYSSHFDLVTPDGYIRSYQLINEHEAVAEVFIEDISRTFVGFELPPEHLTFNIKSALAQLGVNCEALNFSLDKMHKCAEVRVKLFALSALGNKMLSHLGEGVYLGKIFAADERRRIKNPDYLLRMFGRFDREGRPLLFLGEKLPKDEMHFEKLDGITIAYIHLLEGRIVYDNKIEGFLPTLALALKRNLPTRDLLRLHQFRDIKASRNLAEEGFLLVSSLLPLHIRTVFGKVVNKLLPPGYRHTMADVLQPELKASGDIYEFYGNSKEEISRVPLEFYTLEPERENVFFQDRDQLQHFLLDPQNIFDLFKTAPGGLEERASVFVVKGSQVLRLKGEDWIVRNPPLPSFSEVASTRQLGKLVEQYVQMQPCYPFLHAMENGMITSQGVLFTRYFPSPLMKSILLSYYVRSLLMGIYFQIPSRSNGNYFSQEDRALLNDLHSFGIPVYWVDETSKTLLRYVQRPGKSSSMFVPLDKVDFFRQATCFGVYGSNLVEGDFENELKKLLEGIVKLKEELDHPLLNPKKPLALVTGGGPGAMEMGNRMAKELHILSCAHIVDFRPRNQAVVNEQKQNPYVEAKMTYRLDQLIERQAGFYLDFPIFVMGGIGTDFEYSLEEVRHKVGARTMSPIILFGSPDYWRAKITSRFQSNLKSGTIAGSEWVSNSFFCIQNAEQGLKVYKDFFTRKLLIGPQGPVFEEGFVSPI